MATIMGRLINALNCPFTSRRLFSRAVSRTSMPASGLVSDHASASAYRDRRLQPSGPANRARGVSRRLPVRFARLGRVSRSHSVRPTAHSGRQPMCRTGSVTRRGRVQGSRPLPGCNRLADRWRLGSGSQPAMFRAHSRACALSVMPGNSRRSSTAADISPRCSNTARIAAASASLTTNMAGACGMHTAAGKQDRRTAPAGPIKPPCRPTRVLPHVRRSHCCTCPARFGFSRLGLARRATGDTDRERWGLPPNAVATRRATSNPWSVLMERRIRRAFRTSFCGRILATRGE
jgi:hypothetical protein